MACVPHGGMARVPHGGMACVPHVASMVAWRVCHGGMEHGGMVCVPPRAAAIRLPLFAGSAALHTQESSVPMRMCVRVCVVCVRLLAKLRANCCGLCAPNVFECAAARQAHLQGGPLTAQPQGCCGPSCSSSASDKLPVWWGRPEPMRRSLYSQQAELADKIAQLRQQQADTFDTVGSKSRGKHQVCVVG